MLPVARKLKVAIRLHLRDSELKFGVPRFGVSPLVVQVFHGAKQKENTEVTPSLTSVNQLDDKRSVWLRDVTYSSLCTLMCAKTLRYIGGHAMCRHHSAFNDNVHLHGCTHGAIKRDGRCWVISLSQTLTGLGGRPSRRSSSF